MALATIPIYVHQLQPIHVPKVEFVELNPARLVEVAPPPDWNKEVLEPLRAHQAEQARIAEEARKAAQEAAERAEAERLAQEAARSVYVAPAAAQRPTVVSGSCVDWIRAAGIADVANAYALIMRESSCNPNNVNPYSGACGLGQQLPCGKWPHQWNDPIGGLIDMNAYVLGRYGSWANANGFQMRNNWY